MRRRYWQSQATSGGYACYRSFVSSGSCLAVFSKRELEVGRAGMKRQNGSQSVANSSELGHIQRAWPSCMPEVWVWGLPEPFGGLRYAFICVSISFLLRISFVLYCVLIFCTFLSFRLVSAFVLFCALAKKKHFNLQMRNKFQTKAQSFPLQINF